MGKTNRPTPFLPDQAQTQFHHFDLCFTICGHARRPLKPKA